MNRFKDSKHRLGGIKYWAQWMPYGRKPAFELFVYVGCEESIGQHYFAHYKNSAIIVCKNFYQLTNDPSFRPFVLEFAEMEKYAQEKGLV